MSDPIWFTPPPRPSRPPEAPKKAEPKQVDIIIDGRPMQVPEAWTILEACRSIGVDTPTLCYLENLTPVNVCRICVVEIKGARTLAPACSRKVEPGMDIGTDSERDAREPGHHHTSDGSDAATMHQPVKVDNDLYVRDYAKCILCYKCVEACGSDAQNTFAIAVAGRGFDARISTEANVPLPDSACVYCGNCIGVCPTGALMFKSEHEMREAGTWDESKQHKTDTICPYCGVGCTLTLHTQDNRIVKVTSPMDASVTHGHLCIKGRFGFEFVQNTTEPKD